jgi:uncharacterized protein
MAAIEPTLADKRDQLLAKLGAWTRVAVAYSGGVDSAVVAKAAVLACGTGALAVTAVSPSLPRSERDEAARLAAEIGIRHRIIHTEETANPAYARNAPDRCYHCKSTLYADLHALRDELGFEAIVNGTNVDDLGDYRPGLAAAEEYRVTSPLAECGFTKDDVRALARHWELPVWDKPAAPCLSSRLAYGLEVTAERLGRVERAEEFLHTEFGIRELRVRHEFNDLARIEVPEDDIGRLSAATARRTIVAKLKDLGFRYVVIDCEGLRSGSMNQVLSAETLFGFDGGK